MAAIGVLVIGVVDAGLLDGALFGTVSSWLLGRAEASQMAKGGNQNVADTGVMAAVFAELGAAGLPQVKENICEVLKKMYKAAKGQGLERKKIRRTQKAHDCSHSGMDD